MTSLSVGEVAGSLGVAPSTVRMWGSRYGLTASDRTERGHRRYTPDDVDRLRQMHAAVISGIPPATAAAELTAGAPPGPVPAPVPAHRGGPGGSVLAVPRAGRQARGLARAASRLDEAGATTVVLDALRERGTLRTWDDVLRPVLVAAGLHWEHTGKGIEVEHLLTQAVTGAFVRHQAELPKIAQASPILLSGGPAEDHVLALHAARSALAERGVSARFLGPRTPMSVIAGAARRTRTPGVLIWLTFRDPRVNADLAMVRAAHRRLVLLVGGPGWEGAPVGPATSCASLGAAVSVLERAWTDASPDPGRPSAGRDTRILEVAQVAE